MLTSSRRGIKCTYGRLENKLEYVELLRAHQAAAIVLTGSGYHDVEFTAALNAKLRVYEATGGRVAVIGRHDHAGDAVMPANEMGGHLLGGELFIVIVPAMTSKRLGGS